MQNCRVSGYDRYSLGEAATIMSEIMKTMMEEAGFDYGSKASMYLMYRAVQTAPAKNSWDSGVCLTPSARSLERAPDQVFVVEFPTRVPHQ